MLSIGIDVASVHDVAASSRHFGSRYLHRVFSAHEIDRCTMFDGSPDVRALTRCFAAKEAVYKALNLSPNLGLLWSHFTLLEQPAGSRVISPHLPVSDGIDVDGVRVSVTSVGDVVHAFAVIESRDGVPDDQHQPTVTIENEGMIMAHTPAELDARIRKVLDAHAKMPQPAAQLGEDDDLYNAGMTSHASVNVMLALEDEFDVEFPDEVLTRKTFSSLSCIREAVQHVSES